MFITFILIRSKTGTIYTLKKTRRDHERKQRWVGNTSTVEFSTDNISYNEKGPPSTSQSVSESSDMTLRSFVRNVSSGYNGRHLKIMIR